MDSWPNCLDLVYFSVQIWWQLFHNLVYKTRDGVRLMWGRCPDRVWFLMCRCVLCYGVCCDVCCVVTCLVTCVVYCVVICCDVCCGVCCDLCCDMCCLVTCVVVWCVL